FQIVLALHPVGRLADLLDRRQQQPDQDRNDRDHHQQLDQGEAATDGLRTGTRHGTLRRTRNKRMSKAPDGPGAREHVGKSGPTWLLSVKSLSGRASYRGPIGGPTSTHKHLMRTRLTRWGCGTQGEN